MRRLKLGIIGAGNWAHTLFNVFSRRGKWFDPPEPTDAGWQPCFEFVCYDRLSTGQVPIYNTNGKMERIDWAKMISSGIVDAVVAATPPEITIKVAHSALKAGMPVLLEKPLALNSGEIKSLLEYPSSSLIYVDYIHLYSPAYRQLKEICHSLKYISSIETEGFNAGPYRSFDTLFDYGPHDLSMLIDLVKPDRIEVEKASVESTFQGIGKIYKADLKLITPESEVRAKIKVGNGEKRKSRVFRVEANGIHIEYNDTELRLNDIPLLVKDTRTALEVLADEFYFAVVNSNKTYIQLSIQIQETLEEVYKLAASRRICLE